MEFYDGCKVKAIINRVHVNDGRLTHSLGRWFICQNEMSGNTCHDKKGYRFSYQISGTGGDILIGQWGLDHIQIIYTYKEF